MKLFPSKYRALAEQLAVELAEVRGELTSEMHRRVASEAIAEDRAQQLDRAYELLAEANKSRDAAVGERLKSLDLVNTALLNQHGPEKPPLDIKQFSPVPKATQHAARLAKQQDMEFVKNVFKAFKKKAEPTQDTPAVQ